MHDLTRHVSPTGGRATTWDPKNAGIAKKNNPVEGRILTVDISGANVIPWCSEDRDAMF